MTSQGGRVDILLSNDAQNPVEFLDPHRASPSLKPADHRTWKTNLYWPGYTGPTSTLSRTWSKSSLSAEPT